MRWAWVGHEDPFKNVLRGVDIVGLWFFGEVWNEILYAVVVQMVERLPSKQDICEFESRLLLHGSMHSAHRNSGAAPKGEDIPQKYAAEPRSGRYEPPAERRPRIIENSAH